MEEIVGRLSSALIVEKEMRIVWELLTSEHYVAEIKTP